MMDYRRRVFLNRGVGVDLSPNLGILRISMGEGVGGLGVAVAPFSRKST